VLRSGLVTTLAVAALATATAACSLPEEAERETRTNALAAAGKPFPSLAPEQPGAETIEIVAEIGPAWKKGLYEIERPGVVNVSFTSPPGGNHNVNIVGPGAPYPLLWGTDAGSTAEDLTYAVEFQKGEYTFYCSVQGHRQAGMEGKIVVGG
jgi:plastocyanin